MRDNHEKAKSVCIYYKPNHCSFSDTSCWNSHETQAKQGTEDKEDNKCFTCQMMFKTKSGMFKHRKLKHPDQVPPCRRHQTGNCGFSDEFCWNKHNATLDKHTEKTHEINASTEDQDFHKSHENMEPPENHQ